MREGTQNMTEEDIQMKKIVFFGGGPMGEGIMGGLIRGKVVEPKQITVSELLPARREYLEKTHGVLTTTDPAEASTADVVILAVNPNQIPNVTKSLKSHLSKETNVISIACGVALATLEEQLGADKKILRVMPNTLIQSGNGYSAACINPNVNDDDKVIITTVLNALGQTMYVTENMFETFTAFCCTGPIWFYKTVEALIDAGVYAGFSRAESRAMVIKNMLGVAQVLDATGAHPALKVDDMTSPAGVTIEALQVLHQERFTGALMTSVDAAVKKANSIH